MSKTGKPIGILMLETRFPRPVGDIGNPASFTFPVLYETVPLADPDTVVRRDPRHLLPDFIKAARDLIAQGAQGIATSCGFLTLFQDELTKALDVPVFTSSLLDAARLQANLPRGCAVGILTISATSLTPAHLIAANVPAGTPIGSTEGGAEFTRAILGNEPALDLRLARADNVEAATALVAKHREVKSILLECTNMGPYAKDIEAATGCTVWSIIDSLNRFQSAL